MLTSIDEGRRFECPQEPPAAFSTFNQVKQEKANFCEKGESKQLRILNFLTTKLQVVHTSL